MKARVLTGFSSSSREHCRIFSNFAKKCLRGAHFGRFMVPSGGLLGDLLTPQNTAGNPWNSRKTLGPTFSWFWGAQGGPQGAPVGPKRGAKAFKRTQEEPNKASGWPQMQSLGSFWTFFRWQTCKIAHLENIENPSSFSLPNEMAKAPYGRQNLA